jgi:probable phosphoglycerate mutase
MELIFVRHGEPNWTHDDGDRAHAPLTDRGRTQADLTAHRIAEEFAPLSEIVASTALRAQETARPIADLLGLPIASFDGLVELGIPSWSGMTTTMVRDTFDQSFNRPPSAWWSGIAGGESFRDFHDRATGTMLRILSDRGVHQHPEHDHLWSVDEPGQRIAVVSHGGTGAVAMALLLGVPPAPWEWKRFRPAHASLSTVATFPFGGAHVWSLLTFNDQQHLPGDMRSRARYLP